jgi:prophage tail gpP-like protein
MGVMEPAHTFELNFAGDKEQREQIAPHGGQRVVILSHGSMQLTGITQERSDDTNRTGTDNIITGRSSTGLLIDSIIPANQLNIANMTLENLAIKWLDPWMPDDIPSVILNGAASRYIMAGGYIHGARKAKTIKVAIGVQTFEQQIKARKAKKRLGKFGKDSPDFAGISTEGLRTTRLKLGTKVAEALSMLSGQIGAHWWQSVDGSLIIARPDYEHDPASYGSGLTIGWDKKTNKATGGNIEAVRLDTSISERASEYTVLSAVKSIKSSRGSELFHTSTIKDPGPPFWNKTLTKNLLYKPDIIQANKISSPNMVSRIARRTMCQRALEGFSYTILIAGHHSTSGALWVPDSMVQVDDERNNIHKPMYISKVTRRFDMDTGRTTLLELKPPDIWLGKFDKDTIDTDTFNKAMRKRITW